MQEILQRLLKEQKIDQATYDELMGAYTKLTAQNETLRQQYEALKASHEAAKSELEKIDEKIKAAKESGKAELVSELEKERSQKEELLKKLQEAEAAAKEAKIEAIFSRVAKKMGVVDEGLLFKAIRSDLAFKDDKVYFGDKELEEGLKEFLKDKEYLLAARGKPGSGAGSDGFGKETLTARLLSKLK